MYPVNNTEDDTDLFQAIVHLVDRHFGKKPDRFCAELNAVLTEHASYASTELTHEVTILLADLRGFTALSERHQASDVLRMLNNYYSVMNQIIHRYGGLIDKYMGDAIMVVFSSTSMGEEHPLRALACAVEMQLAMDQVNQFNIDNGFPKIFAGIGMNTDSVSSGPLGSDLHTEFSVIGDGVNLAARIESYSLRGQILISESCYQRVREHVEVGQCNRVQVKGKTDAVALYEVDGLRYQDQVWRVPKREIRTCLRLELSEPFQFYLLEGSMVSDTPRHGTIQDISYHGLFAQVQEPVEKFSNIKFALALSLIGGTSRDIYGKIVSVREMDDGYGCGIEFTSLDDESQAAIKTFIDRIVGGI